MTETSPIDLSTLVRLLQLQVRTGADRLDRPVRGGYVGDLLSDVMGNSHEGDLWITRQVHPNIVAVASLKDLAAIVLVNGSEPAPETLTKAEAEGIPVLLAEESAFAVAGKVYALITGAVQIAT
ncbi:MAG: DRTGG domain-containing protein [Syntrophales bacterium]|jgi:hypothetical protein|nr:DRTGG domain-containing protein [Syntrophales bacterium]MDD4338347.1 DRTGG domain-containing protein [Syntrophales bacterium]HOG08784.1 DRTGG domain-containing protein [Syntrophales bacterium]HOS76677.1 DRTGG domain-containing protein [Syntrophales bacterium]HPB69918.1 DRTGG domain-containing protein [Syntrophales bacterium]